MNRAAVALAAVLVLALALIVVIVGGGPAVLYACLFILTLVPGLPVGWTLFGEHHPAGTMTGALLGYAASCLLIWAVRLRGDMRLTALMLAWSIATAVAVGVWRYLRTKERTPLVPLPVWERRTTVALLLVLLLVPAIVGRPFARIGSVDASGDRRYRAYFTADFVWHAAMTAELQKNATPPRNPYLADEPIHYYWTYFLVPAAAAPIAGVDVETALKVNAIGTALLLVSAIFVTTWVAVPAFPLTVAAALALVILAASAEGLAAIAYVLQQGQGLAGLRDLNVDAISRGVGGLRIDNLPRAMWYTPQHSMSYALGLIALPVAMVRGVGASLLAILAAGLALGASVAFNPLVGGLLCAVYGLAVLGDWWRSRTSIAAVLRHGVAALPPAAALLWGTINQVAEGAGSTLHVGWYGPASHSPLAAFALSFGPLLLLVAAGLMSNRSVSFDRIWPAVAGVCLVVLVMHLVTMTVDEFWIGFRTGHLLFVLVPPVVARGLIWLWERPSRQLAHLILAAVLIGGLPTTIIDAFNAQDVENTNQGIGLHLTIRVTPAEQEAAAWVRANTATDAVVQMEPTVRGRDTWSLIPSFAQRRMAAGLPISLMHEPEYDIRSSEVQKIYGFADAERAWRSAQTLGIDYLWVDATERAAYPNVAKFDEHPGWFVPAFRNREVAIYRISRDDSARTSGSR